MSVVALRAYRKKRKFDITSEPRGSKARRAGDQFVVQKHDARRLHYDLRLELDGVMKSWAVTRGPSLVPGEKRLAVEVEDHPIEYNTFEGTIPQGEYGGGTVLIWDRGRWTPDGDPRKGLAKGHLDFELEGEKLRGRWHLVRMHGKSGEKKHNWLLIKSKDAAARTPRQPDILEEAPQSVVTGRSIPDIADGKKKKRRQTTKSATINVPTVRAHARATRQPSAFAAARKKTSNGPAMPEFVPPSLATLWPQAPAGANWVREVKFDGYRMQARLEHGRVALRTRKGLDWTEKFARIADAVAMLAADTALLDGEIVVEDDHGISDFSALQADLKAGRGDRLTYYVFDLIYLDGRDLTGEQLLGRKAALERLLKSSKGVGSIVRFSDHFTDDGPTFFKHACLMDLEGIVSKRADAPYCSGRSEAWVKTKCSNRQEFVVVGYTPSTASIAAVGALTVGYYDQGTLRYAGRVGTGFSDQIARDLWKRLGTLQVARAPVDIPADEKRKNVHWIKPQVVIEAEFRGWTGQGLLRQASFKGLREDKPANDVVREVPTMTTKPTFSRARAKSLPTKASSTKASSAKRLRAGRSRTSSGDSKTVSKAAPGTKSVEIAHVRLSHPDRVYWVDVGVTKQQLAEYYASIWDWIAPHITNRPLALVRCPEGTKGQCFFQKHVAAGLADTKLRKTVDAKEKDVIVVSHVDDLVSLVQSGVLEIHVRGSTLDRLDICDRIVFDLDPGEGVDWKQIVEAAVEVRDRLSAFKLESFVKLSGGKGLHVVVPVAGADWGMVKTFSQQVATAMATDSPGRYLAKMAKNLRAGHIFIDYLRNSREATAVAAYSTRARSGAPVSAPVTWKELARTQGSNQYTVLNLAKRLERLSADPWDGIARLKQKLPEAGKWAR